MAVPNYDLLVKKLYELADELQKANALDFMASEFGRGYEAGQYDSGFHLLHLLGEFKPKIDVKELP
jgi:hypothetical protein